MTTSFHESLHAVRRDVSDPLAWFRLATRLEPGQHVWIGPHLYDRRACLVRLLSLDPFHARGWFLLALCDGDRWEPDVPRYTIGSDPVGSDPVGSDPVGAVCLSRRMSLGRSLEADAEDAEVWAEAGRMRTDGTAAAVVVHGRPFTPRECLLRALEILRLTPMRLDVEVAAWSALCEDLKEGERVTVGMHSYDKIACIVHLVEIDPGQRRLWLDLSAALIEGGQESVVVGGEAHTPATCAIKALHLCPFDSTAWRHAVNVSGGRECVPVDGTTHTPTGCRAMALRYEPRADVAISGLVELVRSVTGEHARWKRWVGERLQESGLTLTDGETMLNPQQCFIDSLIDGLDLHDPRNGPTWERLASTLSPGEAVVVAGVTLTRERCLLLSQVAFQTPPDGPSSLLVDNMTPH